jgi:RNA polymerase-binding transcription factor DksA
VKERKSVDRPNVSNISTKDVQDIKVIITSDNQIRFRYSDQELEEFRSIINSRLDTARKELQFLQQRLKSKDDQDDVSNINLEDGSTTFEIEQCGQLAARQIQFINNLESALIRINNKTYGICRVTGKLIDKARLRAVPHATLSMEAKNK